MRAPQQRQPGLSRDVLADLYAYVCHADYAQCVMWFGGIVIAILFAEVVLGASLWLVGVPSWLASCIVYFLPMCAFDLWTRRSQGIRHPVEKWAMFQSLVFAVVLCTPVAIILYIFDGTSFSSASACVIVMFVCECAKDIEKVEGHMVPGSTLHVLVLALTALYGTMFSIACITGETGPVFARTCLIPAVMCVIFKQDRVRGLEEVVAPAVVAWPLSRAIYAMRVAVGVVFVATIFIRLLTARSVVLAVLVVGVQLAYRNAALIERYAPRVSHCLEWHARLRALSVYLTSGIEIGSVVASLAHDILGVAGAGGVAFVVVISLCVLAWGAVERQARRDPLPAAASRIGLSGALQAALVLLLMWRGGFVSDGGIAAGILDVLVSTAVVMMCTSRGDGFAPGSDDAIALTAMRFELGIASVVFSFGLGRESLAIALAATPFFVGLGREVA